MTSFKPRLLAGGSILGVLLYVSFFAILLLAGHEAVAESSRVVRIGVYHNPPKIFLGADGHISGIFGDLIHALAVRADWKIVPVQCTWSHCLSMVEKGQIDLMPDVAFTRSRAKLMSFTSVPALYSWSELYRDPGVSLLTVEDLSDKKIAVLDGSIQERYLRDLLHNFRVHNASLIRTQSIDAAFALVRDGKADAAAANYFFGDAAAAKYGLKGTPVIFEPSELYFVTPTKGDAALRGEIDDYLRRWQANPKSVYYQILDKWKIKSRPFRVPPKVWVVLGTLSGGLIVALIITLALRLKMLKDARVAGETERKLTDVLNDVDALLFIKDKDLRYVYANRHATAIYKKHPSEVLGRTDHELFDEETFKRIRATDLQVMESGDPVSYEESMLGPSGEVRYYLTQKKPVRDTMGRIIGLSSISTDYTDHLRSQQMIHQLAYFDPLTGLANRTRFLERLQHALGVYERTGIDGALLFIDLDNFKSLNDTLGHEKGDELLQEVAQRLNAHTRKTDDLARLGGDEFLVVLESVGAQYIDVVSGVETAANALLNELTEKPFALNRITYSITASIGIALFSDAEKAVSGRDELLSGMLLKQADMAMYAAKSAGRNQVRYFNPEMQSEINHRIELEAGMTEAMREGQFRLAYQPIVDIDGRVIAAEALVRWHHPEKGEISPGEFIPYAEANGLIIPLGEWVLRKACAQLTVWNDDPQYSGMRIAVNISAWQFQNASFVSMVKRIIEETGANPNCLELELTESVMSEDTDELITKMNTLRDIGVQFSLDDFGTGYSSLSFLKRLPLHTLKIDLSFVRSLIEDESGAAIVRMIVALGNTLGLSVIAEGVETRAQWEYLRDLGCGFMQGYLFGRPMSADAITECLVK